MELRRECEVGDGIAVARLVVPKHDPNPSRETVRRGAAVRQLYPSQVWESSRACSSPVDLS